MKENPVWALISRAFTPCFSNQPIHSRFTAGSARSALFKSTSLAFCFPRLSISGFLLPSGILASTSSMIRSISRISSCIARFAFVI